MHPFSDWVVGKYFFNKSVLCKSTSVLDIQDALHDEVGLLALDSRGMEVTVDKVMAEYKTFIFPRMNETQVFAMILPVCSRHFYQVFGDYHTEEGSMYTWSFKIQDIPVSVYQKNSGEDNDYIVVSSGLGYYHTRCQFGRVMETCPDCVSKNWVKSQYDLIEPDLAFTPGF